MTASIASRKKRVCHRFLKSGKIIADTEDSKKPEATQRVSIFIVIVNFALGKHKVHTPLCESLETLWYCVHIPLR